MAVLSQGNWMQRERVSPLYLDILWPNPWTIEERVLFTASGLISTRFAKSRFSQREFDVQESPAELFQVPLNAQKSDSTSAWLPSYSVQTESELFCVPRPRFAFLSPSGWLTFTCSSRQHDCDRFHASEFPVQCAAEDGGEKRKEEGSREVTQSGHKLPV